MKQYDSYKDAAIPWIEAIPTHWNEMRAKYMFQKENRVPRDTDEVITCFRDGIVTLRKNRRTTGFTESFKEIGYQGIRKGDLVIHQMDAFAGSTGISDSDGKATPVYSVCTPKSDEFLSPYYAKVIRNMGLNGFIQSLYRGIRERSSDFRYETFGRQILPLPPRAEQENIIKFIESKTLNIDTYVAERERELQLLNELKESEIANVITRGLDPNVKMKDSGIFWQPEVPETWKVTRLKHILQKLNRKRNPNDELLVCSNSGEVKKRGESKLGLVANSDEIYQGVKAGDLLIHGMDTWHGAIAVSEYDGMCTPVVHVCDSSQNKEFIALYLRNMATQKIFKLISNGVRQNTSDFRSWDKLARIPIALPTLEEQEAIVAYITQKCNATKSLITELESQINFLKEYKERLIADCVTGQIKVD